MGNRVLYASLVIRVTLNKLILILPIDQLLLQIIMRKMVNRKLLMRNYDDLIIDIILIAAMAPKQKKRTKVALERMLLQTIPETPVPEPYFNIPSPQPYTFPLSSTLLEGIKLLENYYPEDINEKIKIKMKGRTVEKMARYKDKYCMMGKGGNGLLVGDNMLELKAITAFAYGPNYLIIAFEDLRLEVYNLQLKLIKVIKEFSTRRVTYLKILIVPKAYESIILLSNVGNKLMIHRIEKSFFSVLSVKLTQEIISDLNFPVTNVCELHPLFRVYLQRDPQYKNSSFFAVAAINSIFIFAIHYPRLDSDVFWKKVYHRKSENASCSWISWGEANLQVPSREIQGDKLTLSYSFDNRLFFVTLNDLEKYDENNQKICKSEWIQSYPFEMTKRVAFCQQMKKNEVLIVTEENTVHVFHTRNFDIFEKDLREDQIEMESEPNSEALEARFVAGSRRAEGLKGAVDEFSMMSQSRNVSYADTFLYQHQSNEIYFMTQKQFGVYVYCNWRLIADLLKVEQKYECAMIFLIAMHKKVNRFDLGVEGQEKELREYGQMLSVQYINKKLGKIRQVPEIMNNLLNEEDYLKMIVIPLEFLSQTDQFEFLFNVVKDKIVSTLSADQSPAAYKYSESIFFKVLEKFIEHGRVKFIPQHQLDAILQYYVRNDQLEMIDRLAIYFDLTRIDRNIVIQCLLQNNLVVSLAHICTQGNESEFVTPFVKFWGASSNHQLKNESQFAVAYAFRALWYVKLCLQRNWILKEYTLDQYAKMIMILSQQFLSEKILIGLLELRPTDCLNTLSYYFTIENSQIINHSNLKLTSQNMESWIETRQGNQKVEHLLSTISCYLRKALRSEINERLSLYLSSIIIYKTVKFTQAKYFDILIDLIRNYALCKEVNYGLDDKMLAEKEEQFSSYTEQDKIEILSARYINKILTLVYYQFPTFIESKLYSLYEESRQFNLTDLQAEILFLQKNYSNCIEIYIRAKTSAKMLAFQFLENSFKRLVLERKKIEKINLTNCIKNSIKYLLKLQPQKTITLVQNCIPQIQEELVQALSDEKELQLEYLQNVMVNPELAQMKSRLSEKSFITFVALMAQRKQKRDNLIAIFRDSNNHYNVVQCISICEKYQVFDSLEYLYERQGSIKEAMKMAALRIDRILQQRNLCDEEDFAPYIKIKEILDNAIAACKKNNSEDNWQALLDASITLYNKYKNSDFPEDQIEIFFYINGQIIENMASNCSLEHTIDLLQNKYSDLNMGGKMTKAFINILSNQSHLVNIIYISANLVQGSLQRAQESDFHTKLQCFKTEIYCRTCNFPLLRKDKSIHFRCGHAYHKECIVSNELNVCVACFSDRTDIFRYCLNNLNPLYPKVKKVADLLTKLQEKKFLMAEAFRIQEYERADKNEDTVITAVVEKKKIKLDTFDKMANEIEVGNWRVLADLGY